MVIINDYGSIGYDLYLVKNSALTNEIVTGFDFDSANDRDVIRKVHLGTGVIGSLQIQDAAITNAKINDFSFNKGTGGTLTLGGTNNGSGLLNVQNSSGSNVVTLNNTGLTVNNGSITIQNSGGTAVVDSRGLVSAANFTFQSISGTIPPLLGSSTSLENINNGSVSFNILNNSTQVLCIYGAHLENSVDWVEVDLVHSVPPGTATGTILDYVSGKSVTAGVFFSLTGHKVITLNTGTNTLALRWKVGSGTATIDSRALSAIILGA